MQFHHDIVHIGNVVAVFGHVQHHAAQPLVAHKVVVHCLHQFLCRNRLFFKHQLFNYRQAVGRIHVAVQFHCARQIPAAAVQQRLAAFHAAVVQHGNHQKRVHLANALVQIFFIMCLRGNKVMQQCFVIF